MLFTFDSVDNEVYLQYISNIYNEQISQSYEDIYYDTTQIKVKNYAGYLSPGTYYIIIKNKNDSQISYFNYKISLELTKTSNNSSLSFEDIYDPTKAGVIVHQQYLDFFDYVPLRTEEKIYYFDQTSKYNYIHQGNLSELYKKYLNKPLALTFYYIWDHEYIRAINLICREILHELEDERISTNDLIEFTDTTLDVVNLTLTFAINTIKGNFNIILRGTKASLNIIYNMFKNSIEDSFITYGLLNYIVGITQDNSDIKANQIIEIPVYFRLNQTLTEHKIFINEKDIIMRDNILVYDYDTFRDINLNNVVKCENCYSSETPNQCSICKSYNELSIFRGSITYLDKKNITNIKHDEYSFNKSFIDTHYHKFDYTYKTGKVHIANCICGHSVEESHFANFSDPKYCLGCKRTVDYALIQYPTKLITFILDQKR